MQASPALPGAAFRTAARAAPPAAADGLRERTTGGAAAPATWRTRLRTLLRLAYADPGSREHAHVAETLIALVIVSMAATLLEFDELVAARYHVPLLVLDTALTACFALDYALNIAHAKSRRAYLLGPWGLIDLLAIAPGVHWLLLPQVGKALHFLRFLRFLRVLKAAKDLRRRFELTEADVPASVALPYEVFLVAAVPA
ncbi:MAG TPA: ion transporter, partial [Chloroflexota bacterium]|nr:ion transporter [Chloroflexota bacterium]